MYSIISVAIDVFVFLIGGTIGLLLFLCVIALIIAMFDIGKWLLEDDKKTEI